ncbi:MAG TPA: LysR family transcriptional regulator [Marmoricola sp.]|nr:LysR family transcriptional regulator [Marmoricola sp.]
MPQIDLAAVECFVTVAGERHFGHAAAKLGVSVSAVTKRVKRLEASLGVPLILRDSGGVLGLTPAGQRFLQFAATLLQSAAEAQRVAAGEPHSVLRLAMPAGLGILAPLLPNALRTLGLALQYAHPGVSIDSVPTPIPQLTPDLLGDRVDVVLTLGASAEPEVESKRLSPIHRVGLVSAKHPLARRRDVSAEEFARFPMIHAPKLPAEYILPFVLGDVRPLESARLVNIDATNTAHIAHRLLQGREVTVVPLALTANLPPELKRIPLHGVPEIWYHAHRRSSDNRPELLAAMDLMADFTESMTYAAVGC